MVISLEIKRDNKNANISTCGSIVAILEVSVWDKQTITGYSYDSVICYYDFIEYVYTHSYYVVDMHVIQDWKLYLVCSDHYTTCMTACDCILKICTSVVIRLKHLKL